MQQIIREAKLLLFLSLTSFAKRHSNVCVVDKDIQMDFSSEICRNSKMKFSTDSSSNSGEIRINKMSCITLFKEKISIILASTLYLSLSLFLNSTKFSMKTFICTVSQFLNKFQEK